MLVKVEQRAQLKGQGQQQGQHEWWWASVDGQQERGDELKN